MAYIITGLMIKSSRGAAAALMLLPRNQYHRSILLRFVPPPYSILPYVTPPSSFVQGSTLILPVIVFCPVEGGQASARADPTMRRQFINVVLGCHKTRSFVLHRIRSSSLFHPRKRTAGTSPPPPPAQVEEAALPKPALSFGLLRKECLPGGTSMFMPFGGGGDGILGVDPSVDVLAYDARLNNVRIMPRLQGCMADPIAFNVGDALYLLERRPSRSDRTNQPSFQVLKHGDPPEDVYVFPRWHWRSLRPPPYVNDAAIGASALVGDDIWVSAGGVGTYAFDTAKRRWSKAGGWELPFCGGAEYSPELGLWFGLSSQHKKKLFCAGDLSAAAGASGAPELCHVWRKELAANPEDWELLDSLLVHVGNRRFCVARFYRVYADEEYPIATERFAVFTGVEVQRLKAGGGIKILRHKSIRYEIDAYIHWVF
ncbi:hypothetical protein ACQJBY_051520 [Aegilops geniculata]